MAYFSEDDLVNKTSEELFNSLADVVKEHIRKELDDHLMNYIFTVSYSDSPIEQLFALALSNHEGRCDSLCRGDGDAFVINPQSTIECGKKKYRVDFLICCIHKGQKYEIVIECDGHNFHEKTKEQAAKDKQRDRDLQKEGYKVLRFTGSEIVKDPFKCVCETLAMIFPEYRRIRAGG